MSQAPEEQRAFSLWTEARQHPAATAALAVCVVAGAALCALYLPESISLPRRIGGGAVMGGMSWLLVMVGRIIGG
jgi:hypothetical protein